MSQEVHPSLETIPSAKPKLLEQVRHKCRVLHYAKRTEEAYVDWIRRFILFHGKREKDRAVPLPERLVERLHEQIKCAANP